MRYQVTWGSRAENHLAAIWISATDRKAVNDATAWLESRLAMIPRELGESRESPAHRVLYHPPLGIEFEIIEDDKRVIVQGVWSTP